MIPLYMRELRRFICILKLLALHVLIKYILSVNHDNKYNMLYILTDSIIKG